ncbi:MAG: hypothetical protein EXQ70_08765 [Solirubrobacterales bacterium]|nr:hypothetical protein [Solirubrobacterales bacterium]
MISRLLVLLSAAALQAGAAAAPAAAAPTVIRTGGPSAPKESKVAIVASDQNLSGKRFHVTRGGRVVLRGRLGSAPGGSKPWANAYRANLSRLHLPGSYVVHAGGRVSRPWRVQGEGASALVPLMLKFFETNRDGSQLALLHGPSHLNDATIQGGPHAGEQFDLDGGWMDAGDTLHFAQNAGFSTIALEAAARLDAGNRTALRDEADVGIDWFVKAHPASDLFIVQVGDARDHERGFRDPAGDDSSGLPGIANRLAFHWGDGVGGDIGGKVAAALAMAAVRSPEPRRSELTDQARDWYDAGRASGAATPSLPGSGGFYVVDPWKDSLAAAGAALYRATGEEPYLTQALQYLKASVPYDLVGYSNSAPFAAADICGRLGAPPLGSAGQRRAACSFLRLAGSQGAEYARANAFGQAGYFSWGTTAANGAGGAMAAISGIKGGRGVAAGARDYLLGRNPWGASFVAGFGPRDPRKIHSWASAFGNGLPRGAVVGGPSQIGNLRAEGFKPAGAFRKFNSRIVYEDRRPDYVTSEPAIDYVAGSILLVAALGAG